MVSKRARGIAPSPPTATFESDLPPALLRKAIKSACIDFVNDGPLAPLNDGEMNDPAFADLIKNHTELRVELRRRTSFDGKALRMSVRINSTVPGAATGEMGASFYAKGRATAEPSRRCVKSIKLTVAPGTTLGDIMGPVRTMCPFFFVNNGRRLCGCRDFLAQWTRQLELGGFVGRIEYDKLCHRYLEDGQAIPRPLDKGRFGAYARATIAGIAYN